MKPVIIRMVVDLPAPFGPEKTQHFPAFHAERHVVHRELRAKRLGQVFNLDHCSSSWPLQDAGPRFLLNKFAARFQCRTPRERLRTQASGGSRRAGTDERRLGTRRGEASLVAGADSLTRTDDLPLTRRLLYQLSYAGEAVNYRARRDAA